MAWFQTILFKTVREGSKKGNCFLGQCDTSYQKMSHLEGLRSEPNKPVSCDPQQEKHCPLKSALSCSEMVNQRSVVTESAPKFHNFRLTR